MPVRSAPPPTPTRRRRLPLLPGGPSPGHESLRVQRKKDQRIPAPAPPQDSLEGSNGSGGGSGGSATVDDVPIHRATATTSPPPRHTAIPHTTESGARQPLRVSGTQPQAHHAHTNSHTRTLTDTKKTILGKPDVKRTPCLSECSAVRRCLTIGLWCDGATY